MSDQQFSRRAFLLKSAALTAAFTLPHSRILGANDDVRVGIIGLGIKGTQHVGQFKKVPGVRVVAICDPDTARIDSNLEKHFKTGEKPKTYTDLRKLLEDKDIDAVAIAAPNHWHAAATVMACQAGKDVYVEKPATHSLWEGGQMIAAAEKYKRIIQVGTQSRSDSGLQAARQFVKDGGVGNVEYIRGIYYNVREPIGKVSGPQAPPSTLDYNLWCGPAPAGPLMREKLHYDWHWNWTNGNGELGNNMVHMIDLATWFQDYKDFPERVMSIGGRFEFNDDGVTPNTHVVYYDFKPVPIICEIRNLPRSKGEKDDDNFKGHKVGIQVKGSEGYFIGYNTGGWFYDNNGKRVKQFPSDGGGSHHNNFIDAVRSRKAEDLRVNINAGHISAGLCHVGNISHRLGKAANGAKIREAVESIPLFEQTMDTFQEHLLVNQVDVKANQRMVGPWLTFDNAKRSFTGDQAEEANAFLKDKYRSEFAVPDEV